MLTTNACTIIITYYSDAYNLCTFRFMLKAEISRH
uniref:Uncharacterized protein n=1 Tax=Podoviridae sp. ctARy1 TaxID=2825228 RepID=A0A8S5TSP6_9CAUD|nr:MAG TPA: hypothetical protein [Podoviridae sp. ctARy1]